jgi:prevent-host-death family protein
MRQVNIHEAKTNLSKLIERAVQGEPFVIAKSGKPMVTVSAYAPPPDPAGRKFRPCLRARNEVPCSPLPADGIRFGDLKFQAGMVLSTNRNVRT